MRSSQASSLICKQCLSSSRSQNLHYRWIDSVSRSPRALLTPRGQKRWHSSKPAIPNQTKRGVSSQTHEQPRARNIAPLTLLEGHYGEPAPEPIRTLLEPDNLFHSFSNSPSPDIRRRAAFIKQHAYCPHPSHSQTRVPTSPDDLEARKSRQGALPPAHVSFECPDCGIPVSCSEEHWADDYESHLEICDTLRQVNEDDHDLRSGRFFPEFEYPGHHLDEAMINMTNWDTLMYSREFRAINDMRSMRQATRMLTYPMTIGSVLHELSPYNIREGGRMTVEGLRSMNGRSITIST
jgi:mitochondrial splicing suppressor protein 51